MLDAFLGSAFDKSTTPADGDEKYYNIIVQVNPGVRVDDCFIRTLLFLKYIPENYPLIFFQL
ncbi:MAG: hypothetical protein HWD63_16030 [Candidatus Parvibacillus calidus]|nr:MAG: hypothetical protein HWD63_16030 [Candidatus Parvibacillus calidus]